VFTQMLIHSTPETDYTKQMTPHLAGIERRAPLIIIPVLCAPDFGFESWSGVTQDLSKDLPSISSIPSYMCQNSVFILSSSSLTILIFDAT